MTHLSGRTGMSSLWDILRERAAPYPVLDESSKLVLYPTKDTCESRHEVSLAPIVDQRSGTISFPEFRAGPALAGVLSQMKSGEGLPGPISNLRVKPLLNDNVEVSCDIKVPVYIDTPRKSRGRSRSVFGGRP